MNNNVLIPRHVDVAGKGLVLKDTIDCEITVTNVNSEPVEALDFDGVFYIPCNIGDKISIYYKDKKYSRVFKVKDIERSEHFYICEIIYTVEETTEMELLNIADMVKKGDMTTNEAHLKADQLLVTLLYNKGFDKIADAFNKVPKYYE